MFKKMLLITAITAITGGLIWGAIQRTQAKTISGENRQNHGQTSTLAQSATDHTNGGNGYGGQGNRAGQGRLDGASGDHASLSYAVDGLTLTDAEKDALLFMVEEEKLAADVYMRLYELWNLPLFQNIQQSELQHQQAIIHLLEQFGLSNPAADQPGVFVNPQLQSLYDQMIQSGSSSLVEALRIGAIIEELDIVDLQQRLAQTANPAIQQAFNNLMNGSIRHWKSFTAQYERQTGTVYQPQYLSAEQIAEWVEADNYNPSGYSNANSRGYRGGRN